MKKKLLAFMIMAFMLIGGALVNAETSLFKKIEIDYDRESGLVQIGGALVSDEDENVVRLMVLKPGADIEKLDAGNASFVQWGIYAEETMPFGGVFSFETFKLRDSFPVGDYIVRIAVKDEVFEDVISHATKAQILDLLNDAKDAEEVLSLINAYNDVYLLPVSEKDLFSKIGDDGKDYVLEKLCDGTFSGLEELRDEFNKHTALYKINIGPWGSVEKILTENEELLSLDLSDFDKLSQTQKDDVCKGLIGNLFEDEKTLADAIEDEIKEASKTSSSKQSGSGGGKGGSGTQVNLGSSEKTEDVKKPQEEENAVFTDLAGYDWAKDSIYELYEKGIINGRGNNIFAPNENVTRAEAVKMIVVALGLEDDSAECNFADVVKNSWMYPYVAAASQKNVVTGYGEDFFGANDFITREDLVTVISRALKEKGIVLDSENEEIIFDDELQIASYASAAVDELQIAGVVSGSDNCFYPKNNATRAEIAKIIASII